MYPGCGKQKGIRVRCSSKELSEIYGVYHKVFFFERAIARAFNTKPFNGQWPITVNLLRSVREMLLNGS